MGQDATPMGWGPPTIHSWGSPELLMNTHYMNSIKKHWQDSGLTTLQTMLQVHTGDGGPPVPKTGDQEACLSWLIKG